MGNLTVASFGMLLVSLVLGSFGQVFLKLGMGEHKIVVSGFQTLANVIHRASNPWVIGGLLLYVGSAFVWLLVISRVRLGLAYPMISISYFLVAVLSSAVLHEPVNWRCALAGLILISAGVSLIGFGMGQAAK